MRVVPPCRVQHFHFLSQKFSAHTTGPSCMQMHPVTEALHIGRIGRAWLNGTSHLVIGCDLATSAWPTGSQSHYSLACWVLELGWDGSASISGRIPGP